MRKPVEIAAISSKNASERAIAVVRMIEATSLGGELEQKAREFLGQESAE